MAVKSMRKDGREIDIPAFCRKQNYLLLLVWILYILVPLSAAASLQCCSALTAAANRRDSRAVLAPNDLLLGVLYPKSTESRQVLSLDGTWDFRLAPEFDPDAGFRDKWYAQPLQKTGEIFDVKVPSSYTHFFDRAIHTYPGWAWYEKSFKIPQSWMANKKHFLYISAAHYLTIVYVNGMEMMKNAGGSAAFVTELPILGCAEAEGQYDDDDGTEQRITLAINNTLTWDTIPQGEWRSYPPHPGNWRPTVTRVETARTFLGYAGILDSVLVYSTPPTFISDVTVTTDGVDSNGIAYLRYSVLARSPSGKQCMDSVAIKGGDSCRFTVELLNQNGDTVASATESSGVLTVKDAKLWWPFTTVENQGDVGYLYKFQVSLEDSSTGTVDVYRTSVGIRTIQWTERSFLINNKPFYFRGIAEPPAEATSNTQYYCGNNAANCSRQRFANAIARFGQPLTEEMLELADKLGVVVVVQAPAINLRNYSGLLLLENHKKEMRDLIRQTKNHASVVLWSMAKRPILGSAKADDYFRELADFVRSVDLQRRPVTLSVTVTDLDSHNLHTDYLDVVSLSYYTGRHDEPSKYREMVGVNGLNNTMLEIVERSWEKLRKPFVIADYGIVEDESSLCFHEEPERETFRRLQKELGYLHSKGLITGEMNWSCDQYYGRGSPPSRFCPSKGDAWPFINALCNRYAVLAGAKSSTSCAAT